MEIGVEVQSSEEEDDNHEIREEEEAKMSLATYRNSDDVHGDEIIRCLESANTTYSTRVFETVYVSKKNAMMENVSECGESVEVTNTIINLNITVNGKIEKVKFLNCNSVEVNINEGVISYNPPPFLPPDLIIQPNPSFDPTSTAQPTLNDPTNCIVEPEPTLAPPIPIDHLSPAPSNFNNNIPSLLPAHSPAHSPSSLAFDTPPLLLIDSPGATQNMIPGMRNFVTSEVTFPKLSLVIDLPPLPMISPIDPDLQPLLIPRQEGGTNSHTSISGDENISNMEVENGGRVWAYKALSKAEKIWKMAKEIGVSRACEDEEYINKIKELEGRDKERSGTKETIISDK